MPGVIAVPDLMEMAATDLATIGSNVRAAHLTAAAPTLSVLPAAADEVSAGIAQLFSQHAANYHAMAAQAAAFSDQFVQHLTAGAASYAGAEAANVALLLRPLAAAAGSIAGPAATFIDPLLFHLGEIASRLGVVINALPRILNLLIQDFLVDPVGTLMNLPGTLLFDAVGAGLYVFSPLAPLTLDVFGSIYALGYPLLNPLFNSLSSFGSSYFLWVSSLEPLLGPSLFPIVSQLAFAPIVIAIATVGIPLVALLFIYVITGGML